MSTVDTAVTRAAAAAESLAAEPPERIAQLLEAIATEIEALGDPLIETAMRETSLPNARLTGERARTTNQLRMFAGVVRDGTWKGVTKDAALPDRQPLRRPDLRRTVIPIGPVGVWAASNFPLAFSVAGGDTAAALAAGCPVILKAHPAHPETSRLAAQAVSNAVAKMGLPVGVFSLVEGAAPEVSLELVRHPLLAAGTFTGSLRAGRALFDAASQRPVPIPFFAEMGSVNPVFLLSGALTERGDALAEGLFQSVTMGVGQFCTNPGVTVAVDSSALTAFADALRKRFEQAQAGSMLTAGIANAYREGAAHAAGLSGVAACPQPAADGRPMLLETDAASFLAHEELRHEIFGPSTILVRCTSAEQMLEVARALEGSLTATLHGTPGELAQHRPLVNVLVRKAGRLVFNGFPTGVEVCASMQHGGPYPATTDARFTSVGTAAIQRFARPVCYQDCPEELLPQELRG